MRLQYQTSKAATGWVLACGNGMLTFCARPPVVRSALSLDNKGPMLDGPGGRQSQEKRYYRWSRVGWRLPYLDQPIAFSSVNTLVRSVWGSLGRTLARQAGEHSGTGHGDMCRISV